MAQDDRALRIAAWAAIIEYIPNLKRARLDAVERLRCGVMGSSGRSIAHGGAFTAVVLKSVVKMQHVKQSALHTHNSLANRVCVCHCVCMRQSCLATKEKQDDNIPTSNAQSIRWYRPGRLSQ